MITQETAREIWLAYDEIAKSERLLAEIEEQLRTGEPLNLRDSFGRRRGLQLGVPSGEESTRLYDLQPRLAVAVIQAHIAHKRAELAAIQERVRSELLATVGEVKNPPGAAEITAEGLLLMGFRCDQSAGHPIYIRDTIEDVEGCHTALHLLPWRDELWQAELHNWQTFDGVRECDIDQCVAITRLLRTYSDVRRLCAVISDQWSEVRWAKVVE